MALDINGYSATFKTFVDFALKTSADGYDSACAKATIADKKITVSALSLYETSRVLRKAGEKDSNDATRAIFKAAVEDMFGGEARVPESVKKAMKMKDYDCGKPLTARRILAVRQAVAEALEPVHDVVFDALAEATIDRAVQFVNTKHANAENENERFDPVELTAEQRRTAAAFLVEHGRGMTDTSLRLLANYAVNALALGETLDETLAPVLGNVPKFRNFQPGDKRFAKADAYARKDLEGTVDGYLKRSNEYGADGIFTQFHKDCNRMFFVVDGETLQGVEHVQRIVANLTSKVPNLAHRKTISTCMNQMIGNTAITFAGRDNAPKIKGLEMFFGYSPAEDGTDGFMAVSMDKTTAVLEISGDGKTATVKYDMEGDILYNLAWGNDRKRRVAGFKWTQVMTFDLTDPNKARLAGVHIGQSLEV